MKYTTAYDKMNYYLGMMVKDAQKYLDTGDEWYASAVGTFAKAFNKEVETIRCAGFVPLDWTMTE